MCPHPLAQRRGDFGASLRQGGAVEDFIDVVREIDPRFDLGQERHQLPVQLRDAPRQSAPQRRVRGPSSAVRARLHERRDRFSLRQVELSIPVRALGEFAAAGRPDAAGSA